MEGKEVRFGVISSALFSVVTTSASCGAVNSMHDSYTPLGGLVTLLMMQFGEVVYGGIGSGLYGMLVFVIIAMFIAGLMVGRTPEYLGKKIEPREMTIATIIILIPIFLILVLHGRRRYLYRSGQKPPYCNPGPHGFSEDPVRLHLPGTEQWQRLCGAVREQPVLQYRNRRLPCSSGGMVLPS